MHSCPAEGSGFWQVVQFFAQVWASGMKLDGCAIYQVYLVWLGRLAKLITLLSSIPIIFDIIGEERLDKAANELAFNLIKGRKEGKSINELADKKSSMRIILFGGFGSLFYVWMYYMLMISEYKSGNQNFILGVVVFVLSVTAALYYWCQISAFGLLKVLRIFVFILKRPRLCRTMRKICAILFIFSWSLDMFVAS